MIDTHSHLDDPAFDADRPMALQRAHQAGVTRQIIPAIAQASWSRLAEVCTTYSGLYPAYGLHPCYLPEHRPADLITLVHWLDSHPAVALGECGLDGYLANLDMAQQHSYFIAQLRLARERELPVICHARRAVDDVLKQLRRIGGLTGVVHSFSGSEQQAHQLLNLGFFLSFGGPLTYPRAQRLRRLAQTLPLDCLMVESDAPDQPNCGRQGSRNEPAFLTEVVATLAQLRNLPAEDIMTATTANAIRLFRLPPYEQLACY